MQTFLKKGKDESSDELVFLFNGWGMDERPYHIVDSKRDVLIVSDYTDLKLEFPKCFSFEKYKKIILITFSAGVFMAKYLKNLLPDFDLKIAVCGNSYLFDKNCGIAEDIEHHMKTLTLENALDFRKKLVNEQSEYDLFNKNQPLRTLESSMEELSTLEKYSSEVNKLSQDDFEFDKVIIGENDEIITMKNQLRAWKKFENVKFLEGGHFLFYKFKSFDEIINF